MSLPLLKVFVLVLLGEDKSPLLGRFGGVCLLCLLARKEPFLRQTPDDSSLSKLLRHFLGQGVVQDPGVDVTTWGAKPVEFFEDLGILLLGRGPLSRLPSSLSFVILISCYMQGERELGRPISNSSSRGTNISRKFAPTYVFSNSLLHRSLKIEIHAMGP